MAELSQPLPLLTPENRFFWTSGAEGVLRFMRCQDCRTYIHPPQPVCHGCLGSHVAPETVPGGGTVAAFTINHQPWHPAFTPPYALAIVEIDEAPYVRLTTRVVGCAMEEVRIGLRGMFEFEQVEDVWLPIFRANGNG